MKILLYRFFLNKTDQMTFFDRKDKGVGKIDLLKDVFSKQYHFRYRKSELGYVLERYEDNFIYGKLGRRSTLSRILPPERDFKKELEENWLCSNVFIRLDGEPQGGQTIAIEYHSSTFRSPLSPLQAWANKINETLSCEGYLLSIHPVTTERDFWTLVKSSKGKIQQLVLSFSAPNLFKIENNLNDDLKKLQKEYNATETSIGLSNPTGNLNISDSSKLVKQGVEYITKGGGDYKLRVGGIFHSSKDKGKYKTIDLEINLETTDKGTFIRTLKELTNL